MAGRNNKKRNGAGVLTPEVHERIILAIRAGNYDHVAARFAGVSTRAFYNWLRWGRSATEGIYFELYQAVERARSEVEVSAVNALRRAWEGGDWHAAAEWLGRKHPERWSKTATLRLDHSGGDPLADDGASKSKGLSDLLTPEQVELLGRQMAQLESGQLPAPAPDDGS